MAPDGSPLVRFDGVQKSYDGETLVIRNLDLDIAQGEFLTLLGPSGSGKSTCLMMLAGFETPTRGEILLNGRSINTVPPHRRDIGVVFQNYALFPHMTVRENVAFPLSVRRMPRDEIARRARRALDLVQLDEYGDRHPAQLSGGQQQRVALARALVFEPQLVLMDEPLGALDKQLREQMQLEIKHLHQNLGITVVFVTHDQGEALTMSDRVAVFNDGRIQQVDTPDALYERPGNRFVADFIGETNLLDGEVTAIDGDRCRVRLGPLGEVVARRVNCGGVGSRASVSLRPERVLVEEAATGLANNFETTVRETIYHGDHMRVRLDLAGQEDFVVKVPAGHAHASLDPGHRLFVGFTADDCRALDAADR